MWKNSRAIRTDFYLLAVQMHNLGNHQTNSAATDAEGKMPRLFRDSPVSELRSPAYLAGLVAPHSTVRDPRIAAAHGHLRTKWLLGRSSRIIGPCRPDGEEARLHSSYHGIQNSYPTKPS